LKILYHHRTRSKDGQFVHISELIGALRRLGHEVVVVAPAAMEHAKFGDDAGLVALLKRHVPRFAYELMEFGYSLLAYLRLRRAVLAFRPDCLYERYSLFLPSGVWIKKAFGLPMLLEVNGPLYEERQQHEGGIALRRLALWTQRYAWRGADFVLPVTSVLADMVVAAGVPRDRVTVIPNGIDPERFGNTTLSTPAAKAKLGLGDRLVLGFTGFVRDWHGLDRVVDLVAERKDSGLHLLIVGDGPARESLQARARERGIVDRVTVTGVVDRDRVPDCVAAFDVALQPAVVPHASPLKLFEYLAMGRAIVAPATSNISEILTDGEDAVLFDPANPDGMRLALEKVLNDGELRRRIADGARRTIGRRKLTWGNNAQRVVDLFDRLRPAPAAMAPRGAGRS
jgi:glycosyltransferase involved in cell wall biosynthesis